VVEPVEPDHTSSSTGVSADHVLHPHTPSTVEIYGSDLRHPDLDGWQDGPRLAIGCVPDIDIDPASREPRRDRTVAVVPTDSPLHYTGRTSWPPSELLEQQPRRYEASTRGGGHVVLDGVVTSHWGVGDDDGQLRSVGRGVSTCVQLSVRHGIHFCVHRGADVGGLVIATRLPVFDIDSTWWWRRPGPISCGPVRGQAFEEIVTLHQLGRVDDTWNFRPCPAVSDVHLGRLLDIRLIDPLSVAEDSGLLISPITLDAPLAGVPYGHPGVNWRVPTPPAAEPHRCSSSLCRV